MASRAACRGCVAAVLLFSVLSASKESEQVVSIVPIDATPEDSPSQGDAAGIHTVCYDKDCAGEGKAKEAFRDYSEGTIAATVRKSYKEQRISQT